MPTPLIEAIATETGRTVHEVEGAWDKAKSLAKRKFGSNKDSSYYSYACVVAKNLLSLSSTGTEDSDLGGFWSESGPHKKKQGHKSTLKLKGAVRGRQATKDANGKTWWDRMSRKEQKKYLMEHPDSAAGLSVRSHKAEKQRSSGQVSSPTEDAESDEEALDTEVVPTESLNPTDLEQVEQDTERSREVQEPESLINLTPQGRAAIHSAVSRGLSRITHAVRQKHITFSNGLQSIKKFSNGEKLSEEDKAHLKDMTSIIMGVTLAAAIAFAPILPYSSVLTSMYLDHLSSRRDRLKDVAEKRREELNDYEPPTLEEHEIEGMTSEEHQHLQHISSDMTDWVADQNQDQLLNELRSRSRL